MRIGPSAACRAAIPSGADMAEQLGLGRKSAAKPERSNAPARHARGARVWAVPDRARAGSPRRGRVVYSAGDGEQAGVLRSWNIPSLNTSALLRGQGTSLTQPAARRLQVDGVSVAFVGSNGTPLLMA